MIRIQQIGALLVALLLVASMGAAAFGSGAFQSAQEQPTNVEAADEVYVHDDGDAVLVYEEAHEDDDAGAVAGEFGLETQTGLMHVLYGADFDEVDEDVAEELGVTGDLSMYMTPDGVGSSGDMTFTDTEDLDEFDASVDVEQSPSNYYADIDFSILVEEDNFVEEEEIVEMDATTETTATSLSSTGSMTAEMPMGPEDQPDESIDMTLTQDGDEYTLDVDQTQAVSDYQQDDWEDEAAAEAALERQFQAVAMNLGGEFDLTLESHSYDEVAGTADVSYTVTFTGVQDQLNAILAQELQQDPELQLDPNEAQAIADRLMALEIDEMQFDAAMSDDEVTANWDVTLDNYDEVVLGVVEIAESLDDVDDEIADQFDEVRTMLEAQEAADLVQSTEMELYYREAPEETEMEFSASSDAENWPAYVDELEERGVDEFATDTSLSFDAQTVGDELEVGYEFHAEEEAMLEQALDEMEQAIAQDPMLEDDLAEPIEQFRDAEFELARMTMEVTESEAEMEAAMAFEDMESFEGVPFETEDGLSVTGVHVETEDATTTTYVTVEDFVGEDADEDEVRAQEPVGEDTEVHLPGEWDREFPSIDEDEVRSYLEEAGPEEAGDSSTLPGGVDTTTALAGVAVVGGLFLAYRKYY